MTTPDPWGEVPPPQHDPTVRPEIRRLRAARGQWLAVLDDDPTGSQSVHGLDVVLSADPAQYADALGNGAASCFVLTNSRSLPESAAAELNHRVASDLLELAADQGHPLQLVSRSDSTLRGHVMAEIDALVDASRDATGTGPDAVLLAPAFLEAGRVTAGDVHWARVQGRYLPVGESEFARDATFSYRSSNLRDFVAEVSGGRVEADQVASISLDDIRVHGPDRIADILSAARDASFVVVNAMDYSDLELVALGALRAEEAGASLLFRSGPSMVRALDGQDPAPPLSSEQIWSGQRPTGYGMVVVGSHVGQTSRQVAALTATCDVHVVTVEVPHLLSLQVSERPAYVAELAGEVRRGLASSDVLLMTSRALVTGPDRASSLGIAREVSAMLSAVVRESLLDPPAWVVAKGGITSHDIAVHGLGIRRARVEGQLFDGVVSLFRPLDGDEAAIGRPYVVFAGNVGDDDTLAEVVRRLHGGPP